MEIEAQLETRLKENLYRCLEEIKATKAALYLLDDDGSYGVVTHYGFRRGMRENVQPKDEIVDGLLVKRSAFCINSLAEDHRFSEILYEADTSRLLVTPIYSRGKLAGFIDMRDKAASRDFDAEDLRKSASIAEDFLKVFLDEGMYGQRKIVVDEAPGGQQEFLRGRDSRPALMIADRVSAEVSRGVFLEAPAEIRESPGDDAAAGAARLSESQSHRHRRGLCIIRDIERSSRRVERRGSGRGNGAVQESSRIWLRRRGEDLPHFRTTIAYPFGTREYKVTPEKIKHLLAAPVRAADLTPWC